MNIVMDADSFIFSTAVKMQYDNPFLEGAISSNWTMVRESFVKKLEFFKERYNVNEMILYVSGKDNFRYDVFKDYKANRKTVVRPIHLSNLKSYAVEFLGAIEAHGCEADDCTVSFKLQNPDWVMSAIDKDVINSVVGKHLNYWKEEFVQTDEETALQWSTIQCLTGDTTDNIIGLKGVGPKTAKKIVENCIDPHELWTRVIEAYESRGRTVEEAIMNMRLVKMDQFDYKTKKLTLWEPPTI